MKSINKLETKKHQELLAKSPFLDQTDGIIKVGGRLARAYLTFGRKHPTLISDNLKGNALIGYIHANTDHQGHKISSSAIREAGFWPVGGRRRIDRLVSTCVPCRTLRAPTMNQKMADLPEQRLYKTPPFYHCGIDLFSHFNYSRAIHLETLDSIDTQSFKLAFNRFQAIRGDCVHLRSDAGSNFMGARNEQLQDQSIVTENVVKDVRK